MGYPCPIHENPADFIIDTLTIDTTTDESYEESNQRVENIISTAQANPSDSSKWEDNPNEFPDKRTADLSASDDELHDNAYTGAGFFYQTFLLTKRNYIQNFRDHSFLIARYMQGLLLSTIVCLLYWQIDNDQSSIQDRISLLFMVLMGSTFSEATAGCTVCK
jgi:hypothetical protein